MVWEHRLSTYDTYKEKLDDYFERALLGDIEVLLFSGILGFLWIIFIFDLYLNFRQRKILKKSIIPSPEILSMMTNENYFKARNYSLDKNCFNIINSCYSMLQITFILTANTLPWLWRFIARSIIPLTPEKSGLPVEENLSEENEIIVSLVFLFYIAAFSFLESLPWKFYNIFYLEEKYGFNKKSKAFFLFDQTKDFIISLCLILPGSYCLIYIIKLGGPLFYLKAWSLGFVMMTSLIFIYSGLISPMFDILVPLVDGTLKTSIEDLSDRINFPLTRILVVQGSTKSSHSNVYFYGFQKYKKIVLFDTLLRNFKFQDKEHAKQLISFGDEPITSNSGFNNEDILAILSHEFGHWQFSHVAQNLVIGQINLFLISLAFGNLFNYGLLFKSFGFKVVGTPDLIKVALIFQFLVSPYNALWEFVMTFISRQNEFQADEFATKLGMGQNLAKGLIKLQTDNLDFPIYDRLYSIFILSHPPLLERIKAIKECDNTIKL